MKRLILILSSILIFVYLLLSLLGIGSNYNIERQLWWIDQKLEFIAAHFESTPQASVNQLAFNFQDFIRKYNKTIYANDASLMLGDLYSLKKDYPKARIAYQDAIGQDKELSAKALFTIAKTYEKENQWENALPIYKSIIEKYPLTSSGFFMPMYLTQHHIQTWDETAIYYQRIAIKNPNSTYEFNALRLLTICQMNKNDWSGSVKTMREILLKYPIGKTFEEAVNAINFICVKKLHDYDTAINIYSQFIHKYPKHTADPLLKNLIKNLQLLKKNAKTSL